MRIFALIPVLILLGCSGAEPATRLPAPVLDQPVSTKSTPPPMTITQHPVPKAVMTRLYKEVAELSGIDASQITLERAEEATWGDTSLGCPQANVDYLQRIVSGYWVVMHAGQQEFDYRIDHNLGHHRCTGATRQAPIKYPSNT